jgi:acyl-CoA synthetase (AMP-forming)/AMP-acid ligase II
MTVRASQLIVDGLGGARVAFGCDDDVIAAGQLAEAGSSYFAPAAAAPAAGILMTNDRPTVEVVLGALVTGTPIVSLPPPSRGADLTAYADFLLEACRSQQVEEVVAEDGIAELLAGIELSIAVRRHSDLRSRPLAQPANNGFRLVQFSSGSTSHPKAVLLDDAALGANMAAILTAIQPRPGDVAVSWLPLSHDMGLVGMLLVGVAGAGPRWAQSGTIVLLDPMAFLRRPSIWPEALDRWRGTITAAPNFGYEMAARRPASQRLDLSTVRCAIVGGEITRAETLLLFAGCYETQGFDSLALNPAYGMAELGLAATMTPSDEHWRSYSLSTAALADGMVSRARSGESRTTLVASGRPLPGYDVDCDAGDGAIGQIAVRGRSIGADGRTRTSYADIDGWYRPGDSGFLDEGLLYVCGRTDDHLVTHGRNIYAPAIEAAVTGIDGVRPGRVTAVGLPSGDWAVVAELSDPATASTALGALRQEIRRTVVQLTTAQPDEVILVARGTLPLTASGKLQRNEVRRRLLNETLTGHDNC